MKRLNHIKRFNESTGMDDMDGDAYKNYLKEHSKNPNETAGLKNGIPFNKSEFSALIQSSSAFAYKWGVEKNK
ncbi:MAG: hypothetical protein EBU33_05580 [Sphingobacteriia bacterium]|nr:hypothetical protein [Sphingobacteriia bacterium]